MKSGRHVSKPNSQQGVLYLRQLGNKRNNPSNQGLFEGGPWFVAGGEDRQPASLDPLSFAAFSKPPNHVHNLDSCQIFIFYYQLKKSEEEDREARLWVGTEKLCIIDVSALEFFPF